MLKQCVLLVNSSSSIKDFFQIFSIFVLFLVVLYGAYYFTRVLGKYQMKHSKEVNMKIVEAISVGPQKTIQLIKVGCKYVLVGVTKDHITFIKEISEEDIDLNLLNEDSNSIPFKNYMEKVLKKKTDDDKKQ